MAHLPDRGYARGAPPRAVDRVGRFGLRHPGAPRAARAARGGVDGPSPWSYHPGVTDPDLEPLRRAVERAVPGGRLVSCEPLGAEPARAVARKGGGYGRPLRLVVEDAAGAVRTLVFRTASPNQFGHDRRSDRAAELLLAFDTFGLVPDHVRALDVGAVAPDGLVSLRDVGEAFLLTTFAEGRIYAEDLRALARGGEAGAGDLARARALAGWLARLHRERLDDPVAWRRAVRDLLGSGEGIFGLVDAYDDGVPGAPPARLLEIERLALEWRWRLRRRTGRLRRTHGDFHPFNVVFGEGTRFTVLDASRGAAGDPADDVTALSVNYLFFALQAPGSWRRAFEPLWSAFWQEYLAGAGDGALEAAPPFLAWRALVVCCPAFYPDLPAEAREAMLGFAAEALRRDRFDPAQAAELFR
jgi:aminoglycoside phosphotransferase (APT) family kinase protein